jgi:transposase
MTREEAIALYHQGMEVVASTLVSLTQRIDELEGQCAKNSHNSSKPPSSDGYKKPAPKSLRQKSGRKTGGQPGHKGHTLAQVEQPDHTIIQPVMTCTCCGKNLADMPPTSIEKRQVFDLPPLKIEVTEHKAETKICPCGHLNQAAFPVGVNTPAQYGVGIKALACYLKNYQLIPYERTCILLADLFGHSISQGSLFTILTQCAELLKEPVEQIKKQIETSAVVHFDETGIRAESKLHWAHTASTQTATYYEIHERRGSVAIDHIDILPTYTGCAVHDHLKAYLTYKCNHALCNAHHLRELTFAHEQHKQQWAKNMIDLLLEIKTAVDKTRPIANHLPPDQVNAIEKRYQQIITEGYQENPLPLPNENEPKKRGRPKKTKSRNLLERLDTYRSEVLAFLYDFQVPFDNNLAERDLRMNKVQQKISGTFRNITGARAFCITRSYLSTARKNGIGAMDALKSLFNGTPFVPSANESSSAV